MLCILDKIKELKKEYDHDARIKMRDGRNAEYQFGALMALSQIIEWARDMQCKYGDNWYGMSTEEIERREQIAEAGHWRQKRIASEVIERILNEIPTGNESNEDR
jgi:hypothetical protein